ncbi:MAG: lipase maturation factor family protein [Candidatus Sumerlaeaceae bacterium]
MTNESANQQSRDESPPPASIKAVLVFDGDCGFCRKWIARWRQITRGSVEYVASQAAETTRRFPDVPEQWYREGVVLMESGRQPLRCAHAVFRTLALAPGSRGIGLWLYEHIPGFAGIAEYAYDLIARHRGAAVALTRLVWLGRVELPRLAVTRWLFLRGLGIIYFCAFMSLLVQMPALVGSNGILPTQQFFDQVGEQLGTGRYLQLPSILWWTGAGDLALGCTCLGGAVLALLLVVGFAQVPVLVLLWALYLSLCAAGQVFLQFQWDLLLLESGFLAVFLAPLTLLPRKPLNEGEPSRIGVWMLRWLVARFMFQSGIVKLLSGDPTWRDLTALTYHFETQPLPTWIGWFMHHGPVWFLKANTLAMYGIEIGLALLVFGPRGLRIIAASAFALLQLMILLTGNYGFFNWLTLVLCIMLLDDFVWPWSWGGKRPWMGRGGVQDDRTVRAPRKWPRWVLVPVALVVLVVTGTEAVLQVGWQRIVPSPLIGLTAMAQPFRTLNSYGLFAVMTTTRPEITIEGSLDGKNWHAYRFKYKPGELDRRPVFCQPHMPRLDWQMWFAALGTIRRNEWLLLFQQRLLEGNRGVTALLRYDPFRGSPSPKYIRATIANYHFTDIATWRSTGRWWRSDIPQPYTPVLTLREGRLAVANQLNGSDAEAR